MRVGVLLALFDTPNYSTLSALCQWVCKICLTKPQLFLGLLVYSPKSRRGRRGKSRHRPRLAGPQSVALIFIFGLRSPGVHSKTKRDSGTDPWKPYPEHRLERRCCRTNCHRRATLPPTPGGVLRGGKGGWKGEDPTLPGKLLVRVKSKVSPIGNPVESGECLVDRGSGF